MRRIFPSFFVLLVMFLVTACSSPSTTTQVPGQPAATQPAATQGIPQTESGTQTGNSDNQVTITLADNTITPSTTNFQAGVPYTLVVTNTGRHAHNFNINPPVSTAGSLDNALNEALLAVPQDQLGPGQSTTETFTFPESAVGKQLEFSCLIRRHYEDGMKVSITVVK